MGDKAPSQSQANDYYAVITIPADFSQKAVAMQAAAQRTPQTATTLPALGAVTPPVGPVVTVKVNQGKNPLAAAVITQGLQALNNRKSTADATQTPAAGVQPKVAIEYFNPVPASLGFAAAFAPMGFVMLLLIPSIVGGLLLGCSGAQLTRVKRFFLQLIGLIVASAGVAGVSVGILTVLLDMDTPTGLLYVLSWCGSLALM